MDKEQNVYQIGNKWQKKVYKKMSEFLESNPEIKSFGLSKNGNRYKHLLTEEQSHLNFITPEIHTSTRLRFDEHKAGDLNRILTNTAASQPYCFNLIIYLQQHQNLANKLFSDLLGKELQIQHLEPEFTPNKCEKIVGFELPLGADETIGDQNLKLGFGTDADIAVFYRYDNNKKGILLIEFKFIEAEFSVCTSFRKKKDIQPICSSNNFNKELVEPRNTLCGYNKYFNWNLTEKSKVIDGNKIKSLSFCPFRYGLNQLWRNMLLAEQVSSARQCDEFGFWVFSPIENDEYLWNKGETEKEFRDILTELGNKHFQKVYLESIFDKLNLFVSDANDKDWLKLMEKKYRI